MEPKETVTVPETPVVVTPEVAPVAGLTEESVKKMLEETNRAWQSRFDKVLTEKKQTEVKATTVEERIAQIEAERAAERIAWARKEARAKAGIDDELEMAMGEYMSTDAEAISSGADKIKGLWAKREAEYKSKIEQLEKQIKFGAPSPKNGQSAPNGQLDALRTQYYNLNATGRGAEAMAVYLQIQQLERDLGHG
jgi:PHD/YefM family antitoxin component YafN of YafNO toxin-antitoxin module